jgi:uncharacterized protein (TIGR02145 family)
MKNFTLRQILLLSLAFFSLQATAQAPQRMSYQSVLRNSSNALLVNTAVGIKISVLQGSTAGNAVYTETQTATTNANGLLSLQIGAGTADLTSITIPDSVTSIGNDAFTTGTFAGINWANGPYFIKTETDPAGGSNYTITGTQELLSVPYALSAKTAENGITTAQANAITAQANAITAMQAQITALQAQVAPLLIPTVTIGSQVLGIQVWTSINLNVTTYRNGDAIPEVKDPTAWANLTTGAWCHLNNDPANDAIYGKMYNHYAVEDPRGLAPLGYRIPSLAEWFVLIDYVGDNSPKLRSASFNGTNDYGFSVLNGGFRTGDVIDNIGMIIPAGTFNTYATVFWCSDVLPSSNNVTMGDYISTSSGPHPNNRGNYIRLLKNVN